MKNNSKSAERRTTNEGAQYSYEDEIKARRAERRGTYDVKELVDGIQSKSRRLGVETAYIPGQYVDHSELERQLKQLRVLVDGALEKVRAA